MEDVSERLMELEIRYTHQTNLIDELNVELTAANARVDRLERELLTLREMIGSLGPDFAESPDE